MIIFVKTRTRKTVIPLDVEPEDTIQNVKRKIVAEVRIPVDQQRLTFEDKTLKDDAVYAGTNLILNDEVLTDDRTLKDYDIQAGSTIHLFCLLLGRIHVKPQTGKMITLEVVPEVTIENVKKMCEEKGEAVECTRIVYAGKTLEDKHTLGHYNIQRESILRLISTRRDSVMPILLQTLTGKTITLEVAPQDTIDAVKKEVFWKEGMTVEHQSLFYAGKKLDDRKTLKDYNITRSSVLNLILNKSPEGKLKEVYQSKEGGLNGDGGEWGDWTGACLSVSFQLKAPPFVFLIHFNLSVVSLKGERWSLNCPQ